MSTVVLLTKTFPFKTDKGISEVFLEDEIFYIADSFERVIVFAEEPEASAELRMVLPENVKPIALGVGGTRRNKISYAFSGCFIPVLGNRRQKEARTRERGLSVKHRLFQQYMLTRAFKVFNGAKCFLDAMGCNPSVIYSYWLFDTAVAAVWLRESYPDAVAVSRAHGYDVYPERNPFAYLPCRDFLAERLNGVYPCSEHGKRALLNQSVLFSNNIEVSYLGTVDFPNKVSEESDADFKILSCSSMVPVKRVDLIAEALKHVDVKSKRIVWTHYGSGPDRELIEDAVRSLDGVEAAFMGDTDHESLIGDYCSNHFDLFINVSESEGLPVSIMEACACSLPIIATDVGGTSEIVVDGKNGLLLPKDCSPRDVALAINEFYSMDTKAIAKFRLESRQIWEQRFRAKSNYKRFSERLFNKKLGA